jgi:hypothetical protein
MTHSDFYFFNTATKINLTEVFAAILKIAWDGRSINQASIGSQSILAGHKCGWRETSV